MGRLFGSAFFVLALAMFVFGVIAFTHTDCGRYVSGQVRATYETHDAHGSVIDARTRRPIPGAVVTIVSADFNLFEGDIESTVEGATDSTGAFALRPRKLGSIRAWAAAPGYQPSTTIDATHPPLQIELHHLR